MLQTVALGKKMKKFFGDAGIFTQKHVCLSQNPKRTKRYIFDIADRGGKKCEQRCGVLLAQFVFAFKFLYTSGCIDDLLRSREERMAHVADIDTHFRLVGEYGKTVAACAAYIAFDILRMDPFFHNCVLVY